MAKPKLLFLCTGNSCRSQMAEALAREMFLDRLETYSAGIVAHGMNPNVAQVMAEVGLSTANQYSKTLDDLSGEHFDIVVTVCDNAAESCPAWPESVRHLHQPFPDPPKLAAAATSEDDKLDCYRQVRDQIRTWLEKDLSPQLLPY